jgi:hypothetical protein
MEDRSAANRASPPTRRVAILTALAANVAVAVAKAGAAAIDAG